MHAFIYIPRTFGFPFVLVRTSSVSSYWHWYGWRVWISEYGFLKAAALCVCFACNVPCIQYLASYELVACKGARYDFDDSSYRTLSLHTFSIFYLTVSATYRDVRVHSCLPSFMQSKLPTLLNQVEEKRDVSRAVTHPTIVPSLPPSFAATTIPNILSTR